METREKTREELIEEILLKFRQLSPEKAKDFVASVEAIASKSLETAPESFKEYLRLPKNEEFAKEFH